jgi:hypothetical protein
VRLWTYHAEKSAFARDMERYNALVLAGRLVLRIGRPLAISDPGQVRRHLANAVALRNGTGCAEASRLAGA